MLVGICSPLGFQALHLAGPSPSAAIGCCTAGRALTVFLTAAGGSPEVWLSVFPAAGLGSGRRLVAWFCWKCHTQLSVFT